MIQTRIIRANQATTQPSFSDTDNFQMTQAERFAAVWPLTLEAWAWSHPGADQPRLQRSVVRIQRKKR
ncbi:hypothetical protein KAI87_09120 [Myxococcota bacterium]|nr:hypothetical protein [Myxococcota bacterium]